MDDLTPIAASDEALLTHWTWVRRLARQLVLDPARSDDVVQQTWLVALQKRPQVTDLRAWLGKVVRVTASHLHRSESRRTVHETGVPPQADVPTPAELVAQADRWHGLLEAVARLDEPYRSTILLRFYRNLQPRDIARRLGVPAATVRSRLKRGLERLRESLDREHEGNRNAWCRLLVPLALEVPARGALAALGVLVMGVKAKLTIGGMMVAAGMITWSVWPEAPGPASTSALAEDPDRNAQDWSSPEVPQAPIAAERLAVNKPKVTLRGSIAAPDGKAIASARLVFAEKGQTDAEDRVLARTTSTTDGSFRVATHLQEGVGVFLVARADGYWPAVVDVVRGEPTEVVLGWRAEVFGHIRDARTDEPLDGVEIRVNNQTTVTDSGGRYRLGDLQHGVEAWMGATKLGYLEKSCGIPMEFARETEYDVALMPGHDLSIQVVDQESGAPVVGAQMLPFTRTKVLGVTDDEGRFSMYVENGTSINVRVEAEGFAPAVWHYTVRDVRSPLAPRIPLTHFAWIEGTVTDDCGEPLSSVYVRPHNDARSDGRIEFSSEQQENLSLPGYAYYDPPLEGLRTDHRGWFRLPVVPATTLYHMEATLSGYASTIMGPLQLDAGGSKSTVRIVLRHGALVRGQALRNGAPWPGAVVCESMSGVEVGKADIDEQGRYELRDVAPGSVRLFVDGSEEGGRPQTATLDLEPGGSYQQDFLWDEVLALIRGRVTTPSGEPVPDVEIETRQQTPDERVQYTTARTGTDGRYTLLVPPERTYTVGLYREPILLQHHEVLAGAEQIDFELPPIASLQLSLVDAKTRAPIASLPGVVEWMYWGQDGEGFRSVVPRVCADGFLTVDLPIGDVDLVITFGDSSYARVDLSQVPVTDPPTEPMVVLLTRGTEALFEFRPGGDGPARELAGRILFALRDDEFNLVRGPYAYQGPHSNYNINDTILWLRDPGLGDSLLDIDERGMARLNGLRSGRYSIRAFPEDLVFEPTSFVIEEGEATEAVSIEWWSR
jgi:RNA polymerase sigma-70 factor (ECF subfamily)